MMDGKTALRDTIPGTNSPSLKDFLNVIGLLENLLCFAPLHKTMLISSMMFGQQEEEHGGRIFQSFPSSAAVLESVRADSASLTEVICPQSLPAVQKVL